MIYIVSPGDSVFSIASAFSVSPDRLRYDNQLNATDTLVIGQGLLVLIPQTVHQVIPGDTALSIAESYGITLRELLQHLISPTETPPRCFPLRYHLPPDNFL